MAKRLVRAKHKIKAAHIPYRVPSEAELPERLRPVLAVLYLTYNAGTDGPAGDDLRHEAIRLARSRQRPDARRGGGRGAPRAAAPDRVALVGSLLRATAPWFCSAIRTARRGTAR